MLASTARDNMNLCQYAGYDSRVQLSNKLHSESESDGSSVKTVICIRSWARVSPSATSGPAAGILGVHHANATYEGLPSVYVWLPCTGPTLSAPVQASSTLARGFVNFGTVDILKATPHAFNASKRLFLEKARACYPGTSTQHQQTTS